MADATVMDKAWLTNFIHQYVEAAVARADNILKDSDDGKSMITLDDALPTATTLDSSRPLVLGGMAKDDTVMGGVLNGAVKDAAKELARLMESQQVLFSDIEAALWSTIAELDKTHQANLTALTGQSFLDVFEDVQSDLAGTDQNDS